MAVTIHQTPEDFTPSDNPVVWTFSSDETAQDNFVFVVKVYIDDALVSNELVFPENGIYGRYDASNHTSNSCEIPAISSDLIADAANYCKVRITVVERYGTPPADEASASATNIVAWKSRMMDEDFVAWDPADYVYTNTNFRFLNNFTFYPKVRVEDESIRLMFINNERNVADFKVELFDIDGVSIVSDTLNFTATDFMLLICNVSPYSVVASALAITDADFEGAAYYEVSAQSASGITVQRVDIDTSIVYNTYKRLHCLSQWGGVDSLTFGLLSKKMGKISSEGYTQTFGAWNGSSFEFIKTQGRNLDYSKTIEREMKCISDWLPETVQNWMIYNLIGSPVVWVENPTDNSLEKRSVKTRTIEEMKHATDMIFLEEVTIKLPTYKSMIV